MTFRARAVASNKPLKISRGSATDRNEALVSAMSRDELEEKALDLDETVSGLRQ